MKKFYSLAFTLAAAIAFAQGAENFENQSVLDAIPANQYGDGSFNGQTEGVVVNYVHARNEGDFGIEGKGIMLRRADEPSSVEFVIPNGVGEFTFSYRKAFSGGSPRTISVYVDGVSVKDLAPFGEGSGIQDQVYTATIPVNKEGNVKVKISYTADTAVGNKQFTVDNVVWTASATASVDNVEKNKALFSTVWTSNVLFVSKGKSNVEVYNVNGQVVKAFEVNGNQSVNVSSLANGIYFVKTTTNGVSSTTKVVKK